MERPRAQIIQKPRYDKRQKINTMGDWYQDQNRRRSFFICISGNGQAGNRSATLCSPCHLQASAAAIRRCLFSECGFCSDALASCGCLYVELMRVASEDAAERPELIEPLRRLIHSVVVLAMPGVERFEVEIKGRLHELIERPLPGGGRMVAREGLEPPTPGL
jgi:hypothetical protein